MHDNLPMIFTWLIDISQIIPVVERLRVSYNRELR